MARKTYEEINKIMKKEGVDRIFSWTKIDLFNTSPYEYFLKYIKKIPEDRTDCIYTNLGSAAHDILEKFYLGKIKKENLIEEFHDAWTTSFDVLQLKFDRNDEEKNEKIAKKYQQNLNHFFKYHIELNPKQVQLEQFAKTKIGNNLFQGYIDCCYKDNNGIYHIIDWKTSSKYQGAKAEEKCGQLVLYALSLQQQGIPLSKIKIGWNFLKYVNVSYSQKKKDENGNFLKKERIIERCEIGNKLSANAKMWLKNFNYNDKEIEQFLNQLSLTNNIKVLPKEVYELFDIKDCYIYVELNETLINKYIDYVNQTITQIDYCIEEYNKTGNDKIWFDEPDKVQKESYYFATLCGYSSNLHKPYAEYLNKLEEQAKEKRYSTDLLSSEFNKPDDNDSEDLSWLDSI